MSYLFHATSALSLLLILLGLSSCFAAAETGFTSLNYYKVKHRAKKGDLGAIQIERWMRHPESLLSFLLIISHLLDTSISSVAALIGMHFYGQMGSAIAAGIDLCFIILFAEIIPKTIAARFPEKTVYRLLILMGPIFWISKPLLKLFSFLSRGLLRLCGLSESADASRSGPGKEELMSVIDDPGLPIPAHHKEMLKSILTLEEITVKSVMVPRHEMEGIDFNQSFSKFLGKLQQVYHKYVVVYRDSLDQILGFLRVQTVHYLVLKNKLIDQKTIRGLIEPVYCIPECTPLSAQLLEFKAKKINIGFVVDEYGDIQGLLTLSDILEETIANLSTSTGPKTAVRPQKDGSVIVSGTTHLRELNQRFGWNLPTQGPRTLNGLLLEQLSELPAPGSEAIVQTYRMTILNVRQHRIAWVKIQPRSTDKNADTNSDPLNTPKS